MELTLEEALQKAVAAHKAGQTQEADRLYTAILQAQPAHPDANHNMGVLTVGLGKVKEALPFFKTALKADPSIGQFWLSYIDALIKSDEVVDAKAVLVEARGKGVKGEFLDQLEQKLNAQTGATVKAGLENSDQDQTRINILDSLKLDQDLRRAKEKVKEGSHEDANRIYDDILARFPKNKKAIDGIKSLSDGLIDKVLKVQEPAQDQLQQIVNLYQQGQLQQTLDGAKQLLSKFPNSLTLYNIQGAVNAGLGQFDDAIDSYKQAIKIKPDFANAYHNMGAALRSKGDLDAAIKSYKQALKIEPEYAEVYYNMGNALRDKGDLEAAISSYKKALQIKPDYADAYNNMGNALKAKGDLQSAIDRYEQALKIKPDYADAYNNMGNALKDMGELEAAIDSYKKAIKINTDYAEAYNNMGNAFEDKGELEAAIDSYKKAIKIKPNYADAYNNMGNALKDKGDLETAIDSYQQALKIKPDLAEAKANAISLLTSYTPQKENLNSIIKVHEAIRKIDIACKSSNIISDEHIVNLFLESSNFISDNSLEIRTELSQTYRRNSVDLNCKRHMSIFKEHDIIPEFCFGCYKVQVEPRSIIDLIKLYVVFDQLELDENNTRKCMVELRPDIPGFYKGLIYCSGLKQANQIAEYLNRIVKKNIGSGLSSKVKRGCSEYPVSFPDYKEINNSGPQLMNYTKDWKVIEDGYDRKKPMKAKENIIPSLSGLNLNDVLIIRKWVDYAKGIGDRTVDLIDENTVYYQEIHDQAKARLKVFQFKR